MGLSNDLKAINGLANQDRGFSDAYRFNSAGERGRVTGYEMGTISANFITGGTLSLGGTGNVDGILSVKRADGSEVVKADNTGITVNYGSITIKDDAGSSVIDSKGLVGNVAFSSNTMNSLAIQDITGTAWTNLTSLSGTITTTRTTPVLFFGMVPTLTYGSAVNYSLFRFINVNNGTTPYPGTAAGDNWSIVHDTPGELYTFSFAYLCSLPTGTNVVTLQAKPLQSTGTISVDDDSQFGYVILGK